MKQFDFRDLLDQANKVGLDARNAYKNEGRLAPVFFATCGAAVMAATIGGLFYLASQFDHNAAQAQVSQALTQAMRLPVDDPKPR